MTERRIDCPLDKPPFISNRSSASRRDRAPPGLNAQFVAAASCLRSTTALNPQLPFPPPLCVTGVRAKFRFVIANRTPGNHDPITWVGRVPVFATTIIVALYVASMVAVTLLLASGSDFILSKLSFDSGAVLRDLELWRCLTYAFVNPPDPWFIIALVMLYIFGRDVEQFLGRTGFVRLYLGLLLLGPSLLIAATLTWYVSTGLIPWEYLGQAIRLLPIEKFFKIC